MSSGPLPLVARDLVKQYKRVRAVDGVSISVGHGERVGLLGPNGAGKTTTLLMLLGVVTPDEGSVEVLGHRLPGARSEAMLQVGFAAGYVPLPDRLRVHEVLSIFGQLYGMSDPDGAIADTLERLRIPHLAEAMCGEMSSGQKTLVGIAKGILHRPRLLVLDEPTASLDPDVAYRVRVGLQELCEDDGTSLLVTSHNMAEVERLCERVIFISGGKVVADDTPEEVAKAFGQGNLEDVFLELAGTLRSEDEMEAEGLFATAAGSGDTEAEGLFATAAGSGDTEAEGLFATAAGSGDTEAEGLLDPDFNPELTRGDDRRGPRS